MNSYLLWINVNKQKYQNSTQAKFKWNTKANTVQKNSNHHANLPLEMYSFTL